MDPRYSLKPDGNIPSSITLDVWTKFVLMCYNQTTNMNQCHDCMYACMVLYIYQVVRYDTYPVNVFFDKQLRKAILSHTNTSIFS